jgi:hypothetical protein
MALRLLAFGFAADADPEAVALAVRGVVGDGAGFELLAYLEQRDLAEPESVLVDPAGFELPDRGDLVHALLCSVVDVIKRDLTLERWQAGWEVVARLAELVPVDLLAAPAMELAGLREPGWPLPATLDRLGSLREVLEWSA